MYVQAPFRGWAKKRRPGRLRRGIVFLEGIPEKIVNKKLKCLQWLGLFIAYL